MVSVINIIHTILSRLILTLVILIIALPLSLCFLFGGKYIVDNPLFLLVQRFFDWACIRLSMLRITYIGLENLPAEPCIVAANHQSSFDIPLIGYILRKRPHLWLAWAELAKGPLLRFILPRIAVLVDVTSPQKAVRTLVQAISVIKSEPWDLVIFPEGARHTDGSVHPFFGGFAIIAKKINRPVIPVKIIGVNKVYPPKTFWMHRHPITVIIGPAFTIGQDETEHEFKDRVYAWFSSQQAAMDSTSFDTPLRQAQGEFMVSLSNHACDTKL
jgi:1-acyl-sn-glycerol-3-phosphate acyltransferase